LFECGAQGGDFQLGAEAELGCLGEPPGSGEPRQGFGSDGAPRAEVDDGLEYRLQRPVGQGDADELLAAVGCLFELAFEDAGGDICGEVGPRWQDQTCATGGARRRRQQRWIAH
jgi:hypothetical protein